MRHEPDVLQQSWCVIVELGISEGGLHAEFAGTKSTVTNAPGSQPLKALNWPKSSRRIREPERKEILKRVPKLLEKDRLSRVPRTVPIDFSVTPAAPSMWRFKYAVLSPSRDATDVLLSPASSICRTLASRPGCRFGVLLSFR